MQALFNGLAVLAFVAVVVLLFGMAALLAVVRDLQRAVLTGAGSARPAARELPQLAGGDGGSLVLVVSAGCPACRERSGRLAELAELAGDPPGGPRAVLLTADEACAGWARGGVDVVVDAVLLGRVAPAATPLVLHVDGSGQELFRRLVGSNEELDDAARAAGLMTSRTGKLGVQSQEGRS